MIARVGEWRGHPSGPEVITCAHLLEARGYFERHYRAHGADLAVDYHHASVLAAQGRLDRAPAAGWIEQMELRAEGAELWGRVMWTGEAAASIAAGEFRHVSPVLRFGAQDRVTGEPVPMLVHSLALTNTPFLTELEALGLPSGAGEGALLGAIDALRTDERDREAARLVEEAVRAGRVPPSQREFFLNCARRDPEATRECLNGLPVVMAARSTPRPAPAHRRELTDGEEGVCRQLGLSTEAFLTVAGRESRTIEP